MRIAVSRVPGAERVVTPLELFFDLVYVFAIGQLSKTRKLMLGLGVAAVVGLGAGAVATAGNDNRP